jgi:high-affinity iron transporter
VIRRLALAALITSVLATLVVPSAAMAAQDPLARGRAENEIARTMVDRALEAVKEGDYERAHELARSAYLDHYEYVEIPLRLRDPNLVLDTEFKFAALREDLKNQAPLSEIRSDISEVRGGITETDRVLAPKGVAAPAVAFGFSF